MPHIIVEHSADIKSSQLTKLYSKIQSVMESITDGNFDAEQCKCRGLAFDQYFVGRFAEEKSSFIHLTIKILGGRSLEVKKKLSAELMLTAKNFVADILTNPSDTDKIIDLGVDIADAILGYPQPQDLPENSDFAGKRFDISVDIVDMEGETYQKFRRENQA
jgi:5-carboxymethyl-2-hydroxymuconate isomerase